MKELNGKRMVEERSISDRSQVVSENWLKKKINQLLVNNNK